jgi:hypothetical protein
MRQGTFGPRQIFLRSALAALMLLAAGCDTTGASGVEPEGTWQLVRIASTYLPFEERVCPDGPGSCYDVTTISSRLTVFGAGDVRFDVEWSEYWGDADEYYSDTDFATWERDGSNGIRIFDPEGDGEVHCTIDGDVMLCDVLHSYTTSGNVVRVHRYVRE